MEGLLFCGSQQTGNHDMRGIVKWFNKVYISKEIKIKRSIGAQRYVDVKSFLGDGQVPQRVAVVSAVRPHTVIF